MTPTKGRRAGLAPLLLLLAACATTEYGPRVPTTKTPGPEPTPIPPTVALLEFYGHLIGLYREHTGGWPADLTDLYRAPPGLPGWRGPYLDGDPPPLDGWNRAVRYERAAGGWTLTSAGEDGRFGTGDDLLHGED